MMKKKIYDFFYAPAYPTPLALLRITLCLALLGQAFYVAGDILELYGRNGILQGTLTDYLSSLALPNLSWLQKKGMLIGIDPNLTVRTVFFLYLASLTTLMLGWHTRLSTAVAWITHFLVIISGFTFAYGVDHFANIFLFYFIWMPVGGSLSMDVLEGRAKNIPSRGARLALRILQFEMCVIYLSTGIHKALGAQWWNGEAIWRSVTLPLFGILPVQWMAAFPTIPTVLGWGTLLIELGYVFFIWPKKTRKLWVGLTVALHLGISTCLGLVSFGIVMALLTFCIFGISELQPLNPRLKRLVTM